MAGPGAQFVTITEGEAKGLTIGLIPKAGYCSIRKSVWKTYGFRCDRNEVKRDQTPIRIYIREPITRFISAYRFLNGGEECGKTRSLTPDVKTFEDFVDRVLDPDKEGDQHWMPQVSRFDGYNITEMYQFERIKETWPDYIPLIHINKTSDNAPYPKLGYRMDEIEKYYAEDIRVWNDLDNHETFTIGEMREAYDKSVRGLHLTEKQKELAQAKRAAVRACM